MSKPVTNEEVEDVLSSIRRLVSEDKRPLAGLRSTASEPVVATEAECDPEADQAAGRLVLTPALRVAISQEPPKEVPLDLGSVARETWTQPEATDGASEEPLVLFPISKDDTSEPDEAALAALVHDAVGAEPQPDEDGLEEGDYSDEGYWKGNDQLLSDPQELTQNSETSDGHSRDTDADWDVEGNETYSSYVDDDADELLTPEPVQDPEEPDEELIHEPDAESEADLDEHEVEAKSPSVVPLTEKIAALEAAVGEIEQDWEPDGDAENELASADAPAMAWEDDVELDAKGEPLHEAVVDDVNTVEDEPEARSGAAPITGAFGADDQLMDEEALRDLVSEIVRSELQGALGERITRNVRKLVRREIHRALTAQDLE